MAQTGYTPILTYASGTATNVPLAANLTSSASGAELALNYADGKLYYKDSGGVVQVLATKGTGPIGGSTTQVQYNSSGALAGSANLTFNGTTLTANTLSLTNALSVPNGGTGQTTLATGALGYGQGTSAYASLAIGTAGQILTVNSGATAPQWTTLTGVAVTTFSAGTTGFTPSSATSGAVTLAGTLATTNGGTGLTSFTSGGVVYASSTSALSTGSALVFDGTNLGIGTSSPGVGLDVTKTGVRIGATTGYKVASARDSTPNKGVTLGYDSGSQTGIIIGETNSASSNLAFWTYEAGVSGWAERMRIDSTGNVGIGSTPYASSFTLGGSKWGIFNGNIGGVATTSNQGVMLGWNASSGSGDANIVWGTYYTGTAPLTFSSSNGSALTERMRLDSSGNLGLGVTPSAWFSSAKVVQNSGGSLYTLNGGQLRISANSYQNTSNAPTYYSTNYATEYRQNEGVGTHSWHIAPSGTAGNAITFTQAMTLDASGNLLVGTTSGSGGKLVSVPGSGFNTAGANLWKQGAFQGQGSFGGPISLVNTAGGSDGFCFYLTGNPSTLFIQFGANGGSLSNGVSMASTATSWSSASDERLKTAITPFPNALEKVCTLRAGTGRFLTDDENLSRSFLIAQDVQKVLPEAVDVGQDELQTLSLRYQDLIPLLTAAIQEQQALITQLTARITALEGA